MSILNCTPARVWLKTPFDGIETCSIGGADNVNTAAYRIAAGIVLPAHHHPVWELVTVVSGKLRLGDAVMGAGDVLHTHAGESHDVQSFEETVFLVTVGQATQLG